MPTDAAELNFRDDLSAPASTRASMPRQDVQCVSWWLWPHLLSLDAPLVAVVWQAWWARSAPAGLPAHAAWILGLGVWTIYLADRLADTAVGHREVPATLRHTFHARWRTALLPLALLAATCLVLVTPAWLARKVFFRGLALLACAGGYFWLIHNRRFRVWQRFAPKEAVVGGLFALGTTFFPWCHGAMDRPGLGSAAVLFGGLCACNCALITRWESNAEDLADPDSFLNAFPRAARGLGMVSLALGAAAALLWVAVGSLVFAPLLLSGILLTSLDYLRHRLSTPTLRILADAALLTPLVFCL